MEKSLSIQTVLEQKNNYNLAIPFVTSQQVNPYFKLSVFLLYVNTNPNALEIYKVGSRSLGNNKYEDLYILAKPFLQHLATEAGIQFSPNTGDVVKMDANTWKASAFGALKLPDGCVRTSSNFKVIDLLTEEKRCHLSCQEKAENGIKDEKAAKEAEKKYAGEWKGKVYIIAERDRNKYIERSHLDAMAQLRAAAPQKAVTGAMLRVIRDLIGIKGTYTIEELKKPFAVARMSFSPDYNDPLIKQMMLQQCMQSVGNLFGNIQPVTQTISIPQFTDEDDVDIAENPVNSMNEKAVEESDLTMTFQVQAGSDEDRTNDFRCDKCDNVIPQKVWKYSIDHYDRPLCYKCQSEFKNERR